MTQQMNRYIGQYVADLYETIAREVPIIAADCADPTAQVGCDQLTVNATKRLTDAVEELAKVRTCFIEPI